MSLPPVPFTTRTTNAAEREMPSWKVAVFGGLAFMGLGKDSTFHSTATTIVRKILLNVTYEMIESVCVWDLH